VNLSGELFLLDTSVVVHYLRGNQVAQRVEAEFNLLHRTERPLVSVVSVGELLALSKKLTWGRSRSERLLELLRELVVVDINSGPILEAYAEISYATESAGLRMGQQNDLWIAATAKATQAHLITTDKDFDRLHPLHLRRTCIDMTL
jgi:tRNA(fMet)-specific endonuclease VapC